MNTETVVVSLTDGSVYRTYLPINRETERTATASEVRELEAWEAECQSHWDAA